MEIKIHKASRYCLACGKKFEHLEKHHSRLTAPEGEEELPREDYCRECWESGRAADAEKTFSHWIAKYFDVSAAIEPDAAEFTPLRRILYEAIEKEGRREQAITYLAAHLLRRQKAFRYVKGAADPEKDVNVNVFSDRFTGRIVEVLDPGFSVEELNEARGELIRRLEEMEGTQDES